MSHFIPSARIRVRVPGATCHRWMLLPPAAATARDVLHAVLAKFALGAASSTHVELLLQGDPLLLDDPAALIRDGDMLDLRFCDGRIPLSRLSLPAPAKRAFFVPKIKEIAHAELAHAPPAIVAPFVITPGSEQGRRRKRARAASSEHESESSSEDDSSPASSSSSSSSELEIAPVKPKRRPDAAPSLISPPNPPPKPKRVLSAEGRRRRNARNRRREKRRRLQARANASKVGSEEDPPSQKQANDQSLQNLPMTMPQSLGSRVPNLSPIIASPSVEPKSSSIAVIQASPAQNGAPAQSPSSIFAEELQSSLGKKHSIRPRTVSPPAETSVGSLATKHSPYSQKQNASEPCSRRAATTPQSSAKKQFVQSPKTAAPVLGQFQGIIDFGQPSSLQNETGLQPSQRTDTVRPQFCAVTAHDTPPKTVSRAVNAPFITHNAELAGSSPVVAPDCPPHVSEQTGASDKPEPTLAAPPNRTLPIAEPSHIHPAAEPSPSSLNLKPDSQRTPVKANPICPVEQLQSSSAIATPVHVTPTAKHPCVPPVHAPLGKEIAFSQPTDSTRAPPKNENGAEKALLDAKATAVAQLMFSERKPHPVSLPLTSEDQGKKRTGNVLPSDVNQVQGSGRGATKRRKMGSVTAALQVARTKGVLGRDGIRTKAKKHSCLDESTSSLGQGKVASRVTAKPKAHLDTKPCRGFARDPNVRGSGQRSTHDASRLSTPIMAKPKAQASQHSVARVEEESNIRVAERSNNSIPRRRDSQVEGMAKARSTVERSYAVIVESGGQCRTISAAKSTKRNSDPPEKRVNADTTTRVEVQAGEQSNAECPPTQNYRGGEKSNADHTRAKSPLGDGTNPHHDAKETRHFEKRVRARMDRNSDVRGETMTTTVPKRNGNAGDEDRDGCKPGDQLSTQMQQLSRGNNNHKSTQWPGWNKKSSGSRGLPVRQKSRGRVSAFHSANELQYNRSRCVGFSDGELALPPPELLESDDLKPTPFESVVGEQKFVGQVDSEMRLAEEVGALAAKLGANSTDAPKPSTFNGADMHFAQAEFAALEGLQECKNAILKVAGGDHLLGEDDSHVDNPPPAATAVSDLSPARNGEEIVAKQYCPRPVENPVALPELKQGYAVAPPEIRNGEALDSELQTVEVEPLPAQKFETRDRSIRALARTPKAQRTGSLTSTLQSAETLRRQPSRTEPPKAELPMVDPQKTGLLKTDCMKTNIHSSDALSTAPPQARVETSKTRKEQKVHSSKSEGQTQTRCHVDVRSNARKPPLQRPEVEQSMLRRSSEVSRTDTVATVAPAMRIPKAAERRKTFMAPSRQVKGKCKEYLNTSPLSDLNDGAPTSANTGFARSQEFSTLRLPRDVDKASVRTAAAYSAPLPLTDSPRRGKSQQHRTGVQEPKKISPPKRPAVSHGTGNMRVTGEKLVSGLNSGKSPLRKVGSDVGSSRTQGSASGVSLGGKRLPSARTAPRAPAIRMHSKSEVSPNDDFRCSLLEILSAATSTLLEFSEIIEA